MKYFKGIIIASLVLVMSVTGQALAGRGQGGCGQGYGQGLGDCTGPLVNIFEGQAVTITGTVSQVGYRGQGFQIDTGSEIVTVYGIGPFRYWNQVGVDRPAVGDNITVNAYNVTLSDGSVKTIAASVLVGGEEVALRDQATGAPLWRGGQGGRGSGRGCGYNCGNLPLPSTDSGE